MIAASVPPSVTPGSELQFRSIPLTSNGWMDVLLEPHKNPPSKDEVIQLPYSTRVRWIGTRADRDYFTITEGTWSGRKASLRRKSKTESNLQAELKPGGGANVHFDVQAQSITYNGKGPYSAFSGACEANGTRYTQIPAGKHYDIHLPDAPHNVPASYSRHAKFPRIWFRLGDYYDRYLHMGEISEGCVTVRAYIYDAKANKTTYGALPGDMARLQGYSTSVPGCLGMPYPQSMPPKLAIWDDLCMYLLSNRKDEGVLGTLFVSG